MDEYDVICACCGKTRGEHSTQDDGRILCRDAESKFDEKRSGVFKAVQEGIAICAKSLAGPRKPVPALPAEVHATKEFNPDAAWNAVIALSRGS